MLVSSLATDIPGKPLSSPADSGGPAMSVAEVLGLTESLQAVGQCSQALAVMGQWLARSQDPNSYLVWFNYGALLQAAGASHEALVAYEQCLKVKPGFAQALVNLGLVLEALGRVDEALAPWISLVGQKLQNPAVEDALVVAALNQIGRVQENRKFYGLAEEALAQSLRLDPRQAGVLQHWVHIRQKACQWPVYKPLPGISQHTMLVSTSPLAMLALEDDPVKQLLVASAFVARTYDLKETFLAKGKRYRHERLRIGYVSGDLCVHAVGLLLAELLEGHDRTRFELFAYDFSPEDGSSHRKRLVAAFEHFRSIKNTTDAQAAQQMLDDEIDILVDLHGLSAGARPGIFALHPAPLQGTYLGFMGSTAIPWFDFVVVDRYAMPEALTTYFPEKPLYVDTSFIPLTHAPRPVRRPLREEVGLPEDAFVMAAFGNVYKITPRLFDTWLDLLRRIPKAVLWLTDDNPVATKNLRQVAADAHADLSRIIFSPRVAHDEFRAYLTLAHVFLDTYPYNCGSTANDVIQAQVPLVTVSGRTLVSRMGGSILKSMNRPELIATSLEDYADRVVQLYTGALEFDHYTPKPPEARHDLVRSMEAGLRALACEAGLLQPDFLEIQGPFNAHH